MSYINKEEFRRELINRQITTQYFNPRERHEIGCIIEMLDKWPIAEVDSIVRCKDCKHCDKYTKWNNREYLGCSWNGEIYEVEAERYCSYGERRTDDE